MARIPALPQLSDNILFDRSSWESISWITPENKQILNCAADRWETYLKLNPLLIEKMRKKLPRWNGIRMSRLKQILLSSSVIASCGSHNLVSYSANGIIFKCPTKFWLNVNVNNYNMLNEQQKCNILTHEFGHALGFSARILKGTINGYTTNTNLPQTVQSYNNLMINNNYNNEFFATNSILPIENKGTLVTKGHHLENNFRLINQEDYPGLKTELMVGFIDRINPIISQLSIKALAESIGYIEKNPGASEGNPVIVTQ